MLKQFLASTAIVALMAGGAAYAQSTNPAQPQQQREMQNRSGAMQNDAAAAGQNQEMMGQNELLASEFIGMSVYNSTADDAEEIATIEDVLMTQDGQIEAVVLNTGGFFGLGGNDYAIPVDRLQIQKRDNEFWITSDIQKTELEGMTVFVAEREDRNEAGLQQRADAPQGTARTGAAPMTGEAAQGAANLNQRHMGDTATTGSATTGAAQDNRMNQTTAQNRAAEGQTGTMAQTERRMIDQSQYTQQADLTTLTAENLMDVAVVGANSEEVGDVEDVILSADGKVEAMIIDVGGFLGIGGKEVAVAFEDLDIRRSADGDLVLFTRFTEEKLEGAQEYDEVSFRQDPQTYFVNPNE